MYKTISNVCAKLAFCCVLFYNPIYNVENASLLLSSSLSINVMFGFKGDTAATLTLGFLISKMLVTSLQSDIVTVVVKDIT